MIKCCTVIHLDLEQGLFAARTFEKREFIRYYCGSLIYEDSICEQHEVRSYREVVIQVISKNTRRWANKLPEEVMDVNRFEHELRVSHRRYVTNTEVWLKSLLCILKE